MKAALVDFDTLDGQRDFEQLRPIGVIMENGSGGLELRYLDSVTDDASDTGGDNYLRTVLALEDWLQAWRSGELEDEAPTARAVLVYLADQSYPGLRFRNITLLEDEVSLDDAFERFVVRAEPLPEASDEELSDV